MGNTDFTKNWEHGPGAPVGYASSAFRVAHVQGRRKMKGKERHNEQISLHGADGYTVNIHEFMIATIKLL